MEPTGLRDVYGRGRFDGLVARVCPKARICLLILLPWALVNLVTTPALADASCPNEQFRTENNSTALPDCRAYEQVTPAFKGGYRSANPLVNPSGGQLIAESFATLEGSESNTDLGAAYSYTRAPSGWQTTAISPPASRFGANSRDGILTDYDPIGGFTLWNLTEAEQLWRRSPASVFTEVGPSVPPSNTHAVGVTYAGASPGFSHIFFTIVSPNLGNPNFLWPFDTTADGTFISLYEYTGTGNTEPTLVGVKGGPGSQQLISQCGTRVGSPNSTDAYNAISASGTVVYFTAEERTSLCEAEGGNGPLVNELYARVGGEKTLAISEPALPPGEQCSGSCATAAHKEGIFQGASQDGSKVFFLTEQPLLNEDENASMDLYMAELRGEGTGATIGKLVQVSHNAVTPAEPAEVQGVVRVSSDGSRVYFVARGALAGPNAESKSPTEGEDNLYVYEPDPAHPGQYRTVFVATLSSSDSEDWGQSDGHPAQAADSDGRFLLFRSRANLTGDAPNEKPQLYRYDAESEELVRVSIAQPATLHEDGATAFISMKAPNYTQYARLSPQPLSISADGAYVFFESEAGLTPAAINETLLQGGKGHANNVYEWEADGKGGCEEARGCLSLLSDGKDIASEEKQHLVTFVGTDPSGADAFFTTADSLTPSDTDTATDIYDARINGGFPAPVHPIPCAESKTCQGPQSAPPSEPTADSSTFSGAGNLTSPLAPLPVPTPSKPKTAAQVRADKLAAALRICRAEHNRHKRSVCESQARKHYGPVSKAKKSAAHADRRTGR
jgi:hypothetical protein